MNTEWMSQAKCKDMDPDVFFPSDGVGVQVAQRVCLVCPVKLPCLEYALAHRVHEGVWGGTSERERRRLVRHRRSTTVTTAAATAATTATAATAATGATEATTATAATGATGATEATTTSAVSLPARDPQPAGRH